MVAEDRSDASLWINLTEPDEAEIAGMSALGVHVPSLADMEEIEVSSRLNRVGAADVMTVVVPSRDADDVQIAAPVGFVLRPDILVTVRHFRARPFETYPARADRVGPRLQHPRPGVPGPGRENRGPVGRHHGRIGQDA